MNNRMTKFAAGAALAAGLVSTEAAAAPQIAETQINPLTSSQQRSVLLQDASVLSRITLSKVLGGIISTANGPQANTPAARTALLQSLIDTFNQRSAVNPLSNMRVAIEPRPGAAALKAADLLNPANPNFMRTLGVFNRIDLRKANGENCGEIRIHIGMGDGGNGRNFMNAEANVPNPTPGNPEGCKPIARFWKGLEAKSGNALADAVDNFLFTGLPAAGIGPIVHFRNYGGPFGQVRTNELVGAPTWELRETGVTRGAGGVLKFALRPVADSPMLTLLEDPRPGESARIGTMRNNFWRDLSSTGTDQLIAIDRRAVRQGAPIPEDVFLNKMGYHLWGGYNDFVSNSSDFPPQGSFALEDRIAARIPPVLDVTAPMVLNVRVDSQRCGGCHSTTAFQSFAVGRLGGVGWPDTLPFVHLDEQGNKSDFLGHVLRERRKEQDDFLKAPALTAAFADVQRVRVEEIEAESVLADPSAGPEATERAVARAREARAAMPRFNGGFGSN